jgi:hypothetical protein
MTPISAQLLAVAIESEVRPTIGRSSQEVIAEREARTAAGSRHTATKAAIVAKAAIPSTE